MSCHVEALETYHSYKRRAQSGFAQRPTPNPSKEGI